MVQFLNEIIYAVVSLRFIPHQIDIALAGSGSLAATLRGRSTPGAVIAELKSATYHDALLQRGDAGWFARVIVDV